MKEELIKINTNKRQMDITGGTQNSGGLYSPSHNKTKNGAGMYDPSYHRWQKSQPIQGLHARTLSVPQP